MGKRLQLSVGRPVSCAKDIRDFMKQVSKDYDIIVESENTIKEIIDIWKQDKKKNQHLVCFRNENHEWFINFLCDNDVKMMVETDVPPPSEIFIKP